MTQPMRGDVWDVHVAQAGLHPALVISDYTVNRRLQHVAIIPITGTAGPAATHIILSAEAGLTKYPESYVDVTGIRPAAKSSFRKQRGRASLPELARVERQLATYLGVTTG